MECVDEQKSIVHTVAQFMFSATEKADKTNNAGRVRSVVVLLSGRTESTRRFGNVFGLSAGLLRATR